MNKNTPSPQDTAPEETAPQEVTRQEPAEENQPAPEPSPEPEPAPEAVAASQEVQPDPAAIEALTAEAERRGYLRGRNERIAELMREPAVYERQTSPVGTTAAPDNLPSQSDWQGNSHPMILNNPRVSIWDR